MQQFEGQPKASEAMTDKSDENESPPAIGDTSKAGNDRGRSAVAPTTDRTPMSPTPKFLVWGVLLLLAGWGSTRLLSGPKLSEEERRAAEVAVRGVMDQGPVHGEAMLAALREAVASQGPGEEPCPHELTELEDSLPVALLFNGMAVTTGTPTALPSAEDLDPRYRLAKRVQDDLLRESHDTYSLGGLRKDISQLRTDAVFKEEPLQLILVYAVRVEAKLTGSDSFEPGYAIGRAFVFEQAPVRLACAADVLAMSSANVSALIEKDDGKTPSPRDPTRVLFDRSEWGQWTLKLRGDLNSQVATAIQQELRTAAPQQMSLESLKLLHDLVVGADEGE